ncbi:MAG: hypothetical protein Q7J34_03710 [Bacteroidales bacterium]|jgi:hypothetical protein|nr:hypothetical protein [Bacteroidales bacterium]
MKENDCHKNQQYILSELLQKNIPASGISEHTKSCNICIKYYNLLITEINDLKTIPDQSLKKDYAMGVFQRNNNPKTLWFSTWRYSNPRQWSMAAILSLALIAGSLSALLVNYSSLQKQIPTVSEASLASEFLIDGQESDLSELFFTP